MDYLKQRLVDGEIHPGEEINLAALCNTLGVSRTPVREALIQLLKDGFIEEATRKGFRIKKLSLKEIQDLYKIGGLLESEIIASACDTMTEADILSLAKIQEKTVQEVASDDFSSYMELNKKFNEFLRSFCPHPLLVEFLGKIQERLYFAHKRSDCPEWNRMLVADHGEIVVHLGKKDKRSLERLVKDVHWNFDRHLPFIRQFYQLSEDGGGGQ